jgi:transposase-like protein
MRALECGATISKEDVARIVIAMESTRATCPHCGRVNEISG